MVLTQFLQKSHKDFFVNIDKIILKLTWEGKGTRIAKKNLEKKNKVGGISLHDFKTLHSYRIQDCVVLVKGYTHTSTEKYTEPRNRPKQIFSMQTHI